MKGLNIKIMEIIALPLPEEKINIYTFGNSHSIYDFSRRHQHTLVHLEKLLIAGSNILEKVTGVENKVQQAIYISARLGTRLFEAILNLCSQGYGASAMRLLRSLFEKVVDAYYLSEHPEEIDDFFEYYIVSHLKMGHEERIREEIPDYQERIEKFKKGKQFRLSWSKRDLISRARMIGMEDWLINDAYRHPNTVVHNSASEIVYNIRYEEDGSITATEQEQDNVSEITYADVAYQLGITLVIDILKLVTIEFKLDSADLQQCLNDIILAERNFSEKLKE